MTSSGSAVCNCWAPLSEPVSQHRSGSIRKTASFSLISWSPENDSCLFLLEDDDLRGGIPTISATEEEPRVQTDCNRHTHDDGKLGFFNYQPDTFKVAHRKPTDLWSFSRTWVQEMASQQTSFLQVQAIELLVKCSSWMQRSSWSLWCLSPGSLGVTRWFMKEPANDPATLWGLSHIFGELFPSRRLHTGPLYSRGASVPVSRWLV